VGLNTASVAVSEVVEGLQPASAMRQMSMKAPGRVE
jgi:hypothetical protein